MKISCGVIGASGYTGLELIKILISHPKFEIKYIANTQGGAKVSDIHPSLKSLLEQDVVVANAKEASLVCDVVFLALPHKSSMEFAKEILKYDTKVVDLSADYRLDLQSYEEHYTTHIDKENLKNAVYGLPEYYRGDIKNSSLVANPGCYPSATLLGLLPFIDYIDVEYPIFIDAKSGVSGAGKKCTDVTQFVTINENHFAYSPTTHRHSPEISQKIKKIKNRDVSINFVPHLLPITRGMLVSIYALLKDDIEPLDVLEKAYKNEPFIRIFNRSVDLKSCAGTNFCDIFAMKNGNALYISTAIDNLLRGASSQAVVNANIMFGLNEGLGIPKISYAP